MGTLSSPRRLLLRPLFLRRLPLHHLLRPVLPERGHQQLPCDQRFLGRGILDVFCSLPNGTPDYVTVFFLILDSSMLTDTTTCRACGERKTRGFRSQSDWVCQQ